MAPPATSEFKLRVHFNSFIPNICEPPPSLLTHYSPCHKTPMIPQELVDNIVSEVGDNEDALERKSALHACALTSWSFLAPSRKILFSEISLQEDSGEDEVRQKKIRSKLERFLDILQHNPPLEREVRSLTIKLSPVRNSRNRKGDLIIRTQNAHRAILPSILDVLYSVLCFSLTFDDGWDDHHYWNNIDAPLQEALFHFCFSRPITQLNLRILWDLPLRVMTNCLALTSLSLSGVFLEEYDRDSQPPSQEITKLKSLSIGGQITPSLLFPQLLKSRQFSDAHFDLSNLQTLKIHIKLLPELRFDVPSVTYLSVNGTDSSLLELELVQNNAITEFSLSGWRNLQILELDWMCASFSIKNIPLINPDRFGNLSSSSGARPGPVSIQTLIIKAEIFNCTHDGEMDLFSPSSGWNGIDTVLSSSALPNLRTIKLDLDLQYWSNTSPRRTASSIRSHLLDEARKRLPEMLPSVSASNLIQVELEITVHVPKGRSFSRN